MLTQIPGAFSFLLMQSHGQSKPKAPVCSGALSCAAIPAMNLPESFEINNDSYHKRESANIQFEIVERFGRVAIYKRTPDNVQQYGYKSLRTIDQWAVKYYATAEKRRNQYFTSKRKALAFANRASI